MKIIIAVRDPCSGDLEVVNVDALLCDTVQWTFWCLRTSFASHETLSRSLTVDDDTTYHRHYSSLKRPSLAESEPLPNSLTHEAALKRPSVVQSEGEGSETESILSRTNSPKTSGGCSPLKGPPAIPSFANMGGQPVP